MSVVTDKVHAGRGVLSYPRVDLADCPIDFVKAQHAFLRDVVEGLYALATGDDDPRTDALYDVLCAELPRTLQDRRANLLQVLARRAEPDDEIDRLIETLGTEYRAIEAEAEPLARALDAGSGIWHRSLADPAGRLALHLRQMVAVEAAVVIPLMRVRLTASDYDLLTAAFRARRETLANLPVEAG
ncbi:MAG: hypothetical protein U5L06_01315 [Rhodovibrio sp.]|nr:hypothetical protein [Rhodovibrio sp.]